MEDESGRRGRRMAGDAGRRAAVAGQGRRPDALVAGQGRRRGDPTAEGAFELWLHLALHASFDSVAREPIPPELLALIEPKKTEG